MSIEKPQSGRVAIVTGGAGGMGRAYALRLASLGADVIVADLDLATGKRRGEVQESVEAEIRALGGRAVGVEADLSTRDGAKAAIAAAVDNFGRLDLLVNNAGGAVTPIERSFASRIPDEDIETLLGANLFSCLYCCQEAIPFLSRPGGSIINVATLGVHGVSAGGVYAIYSAAKAAVVSITKSLAVELGPQGIRVNCVAPGLILTARVIATASERGIGTSNQNELIPAQRLGTPDDMVGAIEFFASDASSYVTGELLTVNGGASLVSVV